MTNNLTEAEIERIAKLIEECAEVQQVLAKILKWGYEHKKPDTLYTNRYVLTEELADLENAVRLLVKYEDVQSVVISQMKFNKIARINKHLIHNQL